MKDKNLHTIKSTGYKTPENYFESVKDTVFAKLKEENSVSYTNSRGFKVPSDYFETVDSKILTLVNKKETNKVIPLISWKKVAYISGIAASLILVLNVFFKNSETVTFGDIDTASIENYLLNEDINAYDIAPYLSTNEINSEDFVENQINALDIEDYLLQNSDVEHLITD